MAFIDVNATGFRNGYTWVNGITHEKLSNIDLCRAAITVGASDYLDLVAYGWRYLGAQLFQSLSTGLFITTQRDKIVISNAFKYKVQTEQATATYWLSMALTKLAYERRLNIPWLCHVDRLIDQGVLSLVQGTRERGDLAGKDRLNMWHVVEVKGRSGNISYTTIEKAKRQASRVADIDGQIPATASASIIKLFATPITIDLIDPEQNPDVKTSWDIDNSRYFSAYYQPFINRLLGNPSQFIRIRGINYSITNIENLGPNIWIGLPQSIFTDPQYAPTVANTFYRNEHNVERSIRNNQGQNWSIGYDGILLSEGFPEELT